jgi:hypothetical protein
MPVPDDYTSAEYEYRPFRAANRRQAVAVVVGRFLCIGAGFATAMGLLAWSSACREGVFERCMNGKPSFELVFQVGLAGLSFLATLLALRFTKRRSYRVAGGALLIALLLVGAWAVFLDAATHGWDDLKLL